MKRIVTVSMLFAASGLTGGTVHAEPPVIVASLGDVSGRVMIYDGQKYSAARTGMPLQSGSRVVTLKDARASVNFAKGCVKTLEENAVFTVSGVDLCAADMSAQGQGDIMVAQALGAPGVGGGGTGTGLVGGLSTTATVVGGVAAVGVTAAVVNDNKSKDAPASPQ